MPHKQMVYCLSNVCVLDYCYLCIHIQVVLLSATLPHDILEMTEKFMTDPIRILVKR